MKLDREGRFLGLAIEREWTQSENGVAGIAFKFRCDYEWDGNGWVGLEEQPTIDYYKYVEKRDGTLNVKGVEAMEKAFGMPLLDVVDGAAPDYVALTCNYEEYDGKRRLRVQWINHKDDAGGGGLQKADDATADAIRERLRPRLRAIARPVANKAPAAPTAPTTEKSGDEVPF